MSENDQQQQNEDQNKNNDSQNSDDNNDQQLDDILSNLKIDSKELDALKENKNLLNVVTHAILQKRDANNEAKKNRERLAKIEVENKKKEEEDLKKRGEFEKLYQDSQAQLSEKDKKIQDLIINSELKVRAVEKGIKKTEYLKLFDKSKLSINENGEIDNIDSEFDTFFKNNTDLFKNDSDNRIIPDNKVSNVGSTQDIDLKTLKETALKTGRTQDLAEYMRVKRQTQNKK